jgi:deoxyadenosine/deoxycytidine kinase
MRTLFVGIEYAGKSTLVQLLAEYYRRYKLRPHLDDHFSIPDGTLSPNSRQIMLTLPDDIKERMQRMQIQYHIDILRRYQYPIYAGWHIEEAVYTAVYGKDPRSPYYENYAYQFHRLYEAQVFEQQLPDLVMVHLTASPDAIRERLRQAPHEHQIIREEDIAILTERFADEVTHSLFTYQGRTIVLDTTTSTPAQSLDELLAASEPLITPGEVALRALPLPSGDYEVRYRDGVRQVAPVKG